MIRALLSQLGRMILPAFVISFAGPFNTEAYAQAAPMECNDVRSLSIRTTTPLAISVQIGDLVTIGPPLDPFDSAGSVGISFFGAPSASTGVPTSFAAAQTGTVIISQEAGGATISCMRTNSVSTLFYVRTQAQAIQTAILMNLRSRRGQGGNVVTQNSVFVSSNNLSYGTSQLETPEFNAWFSLDGRRYDGDTDGSEVNFTFGGDRQIGADTIIGGYLSYGRQELTTGGTTTEALSPAVGAYLSVGLAQGLFVDANVGYANPNYTIGTAEFAADRWFGAVSLSGRIDGTKARYAPFISLQSVKENQPAYAGGSGAVAANTVTSHVGSVGVRIDAQETWGSGIKPYVSVAVDFGKTTDSAGGEDDYVSPRLGLGLSALTGRGLLRFDVDAGKVSSATRDIGANVSYELKF